MFFFPPFRRRSPSFSSSPHFAPHRRQLAFAGLLLFVFVLPALASSPPLVPGDSTGTDPGEAMWRGIVIPYGAEFPRLPATASLPNPRLYFTGADLPNLRGRADLPGATPVSDPRGFLADRWAKILADANKWLSADPGSDEDDRATATKALGFAWQLTQTTTYRDRAILLLKSAFASIDSDDNLVAHQLTNYSAAYDWVASDASPSDRDILAARLKLGADAVYGYLKTGARSHNHRSKSGAALVSWSLAVGPYTSGTTNSQTYFDYAIDQGLRRVWRYMFTPDGVYRDGAGYYWVYQIFQTTPALYQLKRVLGVDLFPTLQPAFEWQLKTSTLRGWTPPIEDGAYKQLWLVSVAGAYRDTPAPAFHATAKLGELFQWRFFNTDNGPVRYPTTRNDSDSWNGAPGSAYTWPDEFIFYAPDVASIAPDNARSSFDLDGGGQGGPTIFRTDWGFRSTATRWMYFEGTPMSNNHDHADALQVLFDAQDNVLLSDDGYGPNKFSDRAAWAPATQHNVVTKLVGGTDVALGDPSPSRNVIDTPFFRCVEKEAGYVDAPTTDRLARLVALAGGDYLVVLDRTTAPAARDWRSRWFGRGTLTGSANRWKWTTPASSNWGANAELHALFLPGASVTATKTSNTFNPYQSTLENRPSVTLASTGAEALALAVFSPSATGSNDDATLTDLAPVDGTLGAQVTHNGRTDRWLAASAATALAQGDLTAQARLAWWRADATTGAVQQCALVDGTELRRNGALVAAASRAVTAALDLSSSGATQVVFANDTASAAFTLTLARPAGLNAMATFAGASVSTAIDSATAVVSLPGGAGTLIVNWVTPPVAPLLSIPGGNFSSAQTVTLSTPTPGAAIYYTLDGTTPTASNGLLYSTPIAITTTATLRAIASTAAAGESALATATFIITPPTPTAPGHITNLSIRSRVGPDAATLIVGFVLNNASPQRVLLRGVGPTLADYGVTGALANPSLRLVHEGITLSFNDDWGGNSQIASVSAQVGAFPLPDASADAALAINLSSGAYSALLTGDSLTSGIALAEIYDASAPPAPQLTNVSARTQVGVNNDVLIAGFVIDGVTPATVLIRGIGPTLATYGVTGSLADPQLTLFRNGALIAANDDWGGDATLTATFAQVGAFTLAADSRDAALIATLPPGAYTAQVAGADGTTGVALVEVYLVPAP
ncbi:chitobiase/beta-hexosaminidase C-terminal domain-containing protein [Horticoccus luteus]|uniref:Chitobiase/beta-hexosaminidase C-terminal domain-containing protein n=1 Tax=Horticoccus luteus TaxID=2862869 RepID=A0A8F9XH59_9BACT|nr:chitobiase/beta-hexosaminidase C-terminal domain-containing protein [Horticoccus luteus]QYM78970.1 chitobiase/beta-hexosaminidase C-terminal domain-containing protein [Horticoccus luteus]